MWPYHPELLETPVPRYTSFPTAAEFGDDVGPENYRASLERTEGEISLYIHIPFCEKICWYCGCNTGAANRRHRLASYLDALHREIELVAGMLPASARVTRIAFGGGSPNAISPTDFVRLIDELTLRFPLDNPVMSIELDPRTLEEPWGQVIAGVGVTHASMGVQTFAPALQEAIGRVQPYEDIARSVEMLRRAGIQSMNFDLMYGLPGQSGEDLEDSLEKTVDFGADRIALFGYAHVPHMIPRQRRIDATDLPDQKTRFTMAENGYEQLVEVGYVPVGFDHFARPGDPLAQAMVGGTLRRNFQGFTEDQAPVLLGLGASAISSFPDLLIQQEKNSGRYRMLLSQGQLASNRGIRRSEEDQKRGALIESLLCQGHAVLDTKMAAEILPRLQPFIAHGLVNLTGSGVAIAPKGLPYARTVAAQFDPYRQNSLTRFSSAV